MLAKNVSLDRHASATGHTHGGGDNYDLMSLAILTPVLGTSYTLL